jgi:GDPmannose 4,6-dehydratase
MAKSPDQSLTTMKTALIFGVSGQDGAYLAKLLLDRGYSVCGTSRDAQVSSFRSLEYLGIRDRIELQSAALNDFRSVLQILSRVKPDEVYNLAGQTSVGLSFEQPVETLESIGLGTLNILEAIRFIGAPIKFYNAASSEIFGDTKGGAADESTPFLPRSPYAVAKATAFWEVANYREAYGLFACSGILFNHDSPLRPERFVTQKIVASACQIAAGKQDKLYLGNIDIERDWGWAEDYVEAMYLMLQQEDADDYVIATGHSYKLADFIRVAFQLVGLDWQDYVVSDNNLRRPTDLAISRGNPAKAKAILGWEAKHQLEDIVKMMVAAKLGRSR